MNTEYPQHRVEARVVGRPPTSALHSASGVSNVEIQDSTIQCLVSGSFQPFLEALRGHEVISLQSTRIKEPTS